VIYRIRINIDSIYYRSQFDDYLAGGSVEFNGGKYYWTARNSNNGFCWEIDPIIEDSWRDISENDFNKINELIEKSLIEHKTDYIF